MPYAINFLILLIKFSQSYCNCNMQSYLMRYSNYYFDLLNAYSYVK